MTYDLCLPRRLVLGIGAVLLALGVGCVVVKDTGLVHGQLPEALTPSTTATTTP